VEGGKKKIDGKKPERKRESSHHGRRGKERGQTCIEDEPRFIKKLSEIYEVKMTPESERRGRKKDKKGRKEGENGSPMSTCGQISNGLGGGVWVKRKEEKMGMVGRGRRGEEMPAER